MYLCYTRNMYLGVDIGGTKTLVGVLDNNGVITERSRFSTPASYNDFLDKLRKSLASFHVQDFHAAGVALPGRLNRKQGVGIRLGNLEWENIHIQADSEKILKCPVVVENDAKLGGLSEAMLLKDKYRKVLYVTISTGIGTALIVDQKIDTALGDSGGRSLLLEYRGNQVPWEDFASGRAIVERFGKLAKDIEDAKTWRIIAHDISKGLIELIALTEPEVIVIGGSVGVYFRRYYKPLTKELERYHLPLITLPPIMAAQRPEEAVLYGCYDLAHEIYGTHR